MKKNKKLPKEEVIGVRCTTEQKKLLEAVAAQEGLGASSWLLHVGLREAQTRQAAVSK